MTEIPMEVVTALTAAKNKIAKDIEGTLNALEARENAIEANGAKLFEIITAQKKVIETAYVTIENAIAEFGQSTLDSSHGLSNASNMITEKEKQQ